MKRFLVLAAMFAPAVLTACGQPEVTAEAAITDPNTGERVALSDLPVRLLPYDRDAIFDSLTSAYSEPEPEIPQEIVAQQQAVQEAQARWRTAEERWGTVRDSLRILSEELTRMQNEGMRGTPQYSQRFERFGVLESEERRVNQAQLDAFAEFDQLQQETLTAADSIRVVRDIWAEEAYADFGNVVAARLQESGGEELADTTNAQGVASFNAKAGSYWLYGRYTLPYEELYWNVPVEITGDSVHVELTRENAQVRPVL